MHSNAVDLPQSYGRFVRGTNLLSLLKSNFLIVFDDEAPGLLFTTTLSLGGEGKSRSWAVQPSALEPAEFPNRPLVTLSCSPNKKETTVSRAVRMLMHRLLVASSDGGGGGMMMIQQQHGRSLPWPMPKPTTDPSQTKSHRISYGGLRSTCLKIVVSACYHTSLPFTVSRQRDSSPHHPVRCPLSLAAPNKESQHFSRSPIVFSSIYNWHLATIGVALSTITLQY